MSTSGDKPQLFCETCGAMLQRVGKFEDQCAACLLGLAVDTGGFRAGNTPKGKHRTEVTEATEGRRDEGEAQSANAERYDHYRVATHNDGTPVELGRGAMGVTFKASDTILGNDVALKVINARIATHPEAQGRFLREARAAARLRHPNVASVFYYGTRKRDGQCFYAMELVEGETLAARLRRSGPLAPAVALEVVSQVAKALIAIEGRGLVHRDLKPANLMLVERPELTLKVIDFGLAKAAATDGSESDTTHGGFAGTPSFASPEQFSDAGLDVRSDLYSLGITLWEMLTGRTPFRGTPLEVRDQHQHAPLPIHLLQAVPQPLVVLLGMLLEKDPGRRLQNPAELLRVIPQIAAALDEHRPIGSRAILGPERISVSRLPVTGSDVFGRDEEVAFLDNAWARPNVNVVMIVAWAGVGKSTLVNHWLRQMALEQYRSAELVFGWSFYRQANRREFSSADEFIDAALAWFGDPDPRLGTAWEKGERLARRISHRRTLLVLDGLEPLQNAPGPQEGRIRAPALQALLRELAAFNAGLCVITTRMPVADIADHERSSVLRRELEQLSSEAGAQLLKALGVKGTEGELRSASAEFNGHGLALTLMGSYLADAYDGNIRRRSEVAARLAHDVRQGAQARKVMESYQAWLGEGPELALLRMLGLFDRPADEQALRALMKPPAIRGLTESLTQLHPTAWRTILAKLRRAKLLAGEDPCGPGDLDTHPLVREYFGDQLRIQQTEAWEECNRRLFEYYRALAPQLPDSFKEMEPLFLAVISGCHAGFFREALHEVYIPRIQRGTACYAAKVLGATVPLLSVLVHFFECERWGSFVETAVEGQSLTAEDQLLILMQTGSYLTATRGLGAPEARLCYERAEPLCHSLNQPRLLYVALIGQWRYSLMTDKLTATMQLAKRVYSLAQFENDGGLLLGAYRALSCTLHYCGGFEAAREYALRGLEIWRSGGVGSCAEDLHSPVVSCLCFLTLSEWHLGNVTANQATIAEAISVAMELKDMNALAFALAWAAGLGQCERDPAEVERLASHLIELSTHHHFAYWLAVGAIHRGWARSAAGDTVEGIPWIEQGIRDFRETGAALALPYFLSLKAEAFYLADRTSEALETIEEALKLGERFAEHERSAELHRLRGLFLATLGADQAAIEASFGEAIRIANQQKSVSLEKRAEKTYAEYQRQKVNPSAGGHGFRFPLVCV